MMLRLEKDSACTIAAVLLLSGCAGSEGLKFPFGEPDAKVQVSPSADACGTPQDCAVHLKKMVGDPKRDWIGQPQSPDAYANGTRLYAYRVLRKKLTCNELQRALEDTKAATSMLEDARYQRARVLVADVGKELSAEQAKRCHG